MAISELDRVQQFKVLKEQEYTENADSLITNMTFETEQRN